MNFSNEQDFEDALVDFLTHYGWSKDILEYQTEEDLLKNWAKILFDNNRTKDRLNDYPLTEGEMNQIIEQINNLRSPMRLNGFINGKHVQILRDNPDDKEHLGHTISLKIYDRQEIAAGQSTYQIVRQPKFKSSNKILNDRRGDVLLLINGMPVIHLELKRSGIPVSQAYNQIEKYSREGIFKQGIFSLIQVFCAMTPEDCLYFANPGYDQKFNPDFYFHWADFNNEPVKDWKEFTKAVLSIPAAHQLIGFYTISDRAQGSLKVLRSYQYYAVNRIYDVVKRHDWSRKDQRGGFIWHTTGSGKTTTSYKAAQLIAGSKEADKVIFLLDRVELGTQSLNEYRSFSSDDQDIQDTKNTQSLIQKLRSTNPDDTLIVTSIQKMSNLGDEIESKAHDIELIQSKRIVCIVDECHRSTFGKMLTDIKSLLPRALFFGFTGTPIHEENQKKGNTTSSIFGNELHRYSIADGIRDKNVLGFDPYMVSTFDESEIKNQIALDKANVKDERELKDDPQKSKIYYHYIDLPMAGTTNEKGEYQKGIEDYIPDSQYLTKEHQIEIIKNIKTNWIRLSRNYVFHAIFATSSITEAIDYYRLFKKEFPEINVTALFDTNIDNDDVDRSINKEQGLEEIIEDYNNRYDTAFTIKSFALMKKDISSRMSHKSPYERIDKTPEKQINILIVVDQMLTGFDSKWVNTLYLDKMLRYEGLIQAFSRTNRLFGPSKPFGTIKYYRRPHTMHRNLDDALKLYSGEKPFALFVQRLDSNIKEMNILTEKIRELFTKNGVLDLKKLPEDREDKVLFAKHFNKLNSLLESAKIQGFNFDQQEYEFGGSEDIESYKVRSELTNDDYNIFLIRYKELKGTVSEPGPGPDPDEPPYDLKGYLLEMHNKQIDANYMNSKFTKYLKELKKSSNQAELESVKKARQELHQSYMFLSQEQQRAADLFLDDILSGDIIPDENKLFIDYINDYLNKEYNERNHQLSKIFGLNESKLNTIMKQNINENNLNEFGRFDDLVRDIDINKAKVFLENKESKKLTPPIVRVKAHAFIRDYILKGGFEI